MGVDGAYRQKRPPRGDLLESGRMIHSDEPPVDMSEGVSKSYCHGVSVENCDRRIRYGRARGSLVAAARP